MRPQVLLNLAVILIVVFVVSFRAYDYLIVDNITLQVYTSCNPTTEKCFIVTDPDTADYDYQSQPYKKVEVIDRYAPDCLEEHRCQSFSCVGVPSCKETFCNEDSLEGSESCVEGNENNI